MTQFDPIVNAGLLYVNNLQVTNDATTPNTKIDVAAGQCRDSNNIMDLVLSTAVVINAASNGYNGLDSGSLANSTYYYVFIIGDSTNSNPVGAMISTSATAPYLPFGYDSFRLIDWQKTDGSAHFLLNYNVGNGNARMKQWDAPLSVTVTGSGTSATYLAMDLSTGIAPSLFSQAYIYYKWDPNAAADILNFRPTGATGDCIISTAITTAVQDSYMWIIPKIASAVPKIDYKISAGTLTAVAINAVMLNI